MSHIDVYPYEAHKTIVHLYYRDEAGQEDSVADFSINWSFHARYGSEDWLITDVGQVEVTAWTNHIIFYAVNDTPTVVYLKDLHRTAEDDILTAALEDMISRGYWEFFEQGYGYLLQYDPAFIQPYIDRYAAGEFTAAEQTAGGEIRTSYKMAFARSITE